MVPYHHSLHNFYITNVCGMYVGYMFALLEEEYNSIHYGDLSTYSHLPNHMIIINHVISLSDHVIS